MRIFGKKKDDGREALRKQYRTIKRQILDKISASYPFEVILDVDNRIAQISEGLNIKKGVIIFDLVKPDYIQTLKDLITGDLRKGPEVVLKDGRALIIFPTSDPHKFKIKAV